METARDTAPRAPALAPVLAAIGGLAVTQSVVSGIAFVGLPAIIREAGLSLDRIGLVYLLYLPWVLKFLWAPAVERYRLPSDGRSRTTEIVVTGTAVAAAAIAATALPGPGAFSALLGCLFVAAFVTATVDIASDGFTVVTLSGRQRGGGNAVQVGGAYFGLSLGGAAFPYLAAEAGWPVAAAVTAALLLALALPFLALAPGLGPAARRDHRPSLGAALRAPPVQAGLALVLIFGLGQRLAQGMLGPYLIDTGLSLSAVAAVNGLAGSGLGILGTLVGGALVRWTGSRRAVGWAIRAQAISVGALAVAAASSSSSAVIAFLALANAGSAALGFVAVYAELMGYASPQQAGVDFTLFQCADALGALVGGTASGALAAQIGYPACFGLAAVMALAAIPATARLVRHAPR